MGKTRTSVGTQVVRVIEDKMLPSSVRTGQTKALLKPGKDGLLEHVLEEFASGLALKAERMYEAAKTSYAYGLPSGQYTRPSTTVQDAVLSTLLAIEGKPAQLSYMSWGAPNSQHIGWVQLMAHHGYSPDTNQLANLTAAKGTPVYLEDMIVVIPAAQLASTSGASLEQWGPAPCSGYTPAGDRKDLSPEARLTIKATPPRTDPIATGEHLLIRYTWATANGLAQDSFTIPVAGYDDQANYFHVRYTVDGKVKYWMYRDGAETYPVLDTVYDRLPQDGGTYFPFIYYRLNKQAQDTDKNAQHYKDSKRLLKKLGMDYDQISTAINTNPDIKDVEQAILMFAVPANTTNPIERRYLFDYFNALYLAQVPGERTSSETQSKLQRVMSAVLGDQSPDIVIQDSQFKMALRNRGIFKRLVAGSIGQVGAYDSGFALGGTTLEVFNPQTGLAESVVTPMNHHYFRKQISKAYYAEIQVASLETQFFIWNGYNTIGDETDNILVVPLDHSITEHYPLPKRELLYARSLHHVFNSRVVTKLKWYQRGWFKVLLVVVAIVVTIYTYGSTAQTFGALLSAGAYSAAAILVAQVVLQVVVARALFRLFVKAVGAEFAFLLAIAAVAYGATEVLDAGSLAGAPFAQELLALSTGIMSAVGDAYTAELSDLMGEYSDWQKFAQEQTATLEKTKSLLDQRVALDPFVIFGETPDEYYDRTIHAGNIGVLGIAAISSFVDMSLTLPKIHQTIKDIGGSDDV